MPRSALRARLMKTHDLTPNRSRLGGSCARELDMKEATKRAASEALAQTLAVTAMLVIASVVFYWR